MMKTKLVLVLLFASLSSFAQVSGLSGINTKSPNSNTILHVSEGDAAAKTFKGVLVPKFTTTERNTKFTGLTAADNGLLIYNITDNCYNFFKFEAGAASGKWINLCQPESPATGITHSYMGAPVMIKRTYGTGDMNEDNLASTRPSPINLRLPKDDWLQLDFGKTPYPGTIRLYINNISDASISLTGRSVSNNYEDGISRNYTIGSGSSTPDPGIDPYTPTPGAFGYTSPWGEQVIYTFTAIKGGVTRKYYAVWTSYPSHESGLAGGGVKADLYRYEDGL